MRAGRLNTRVDIRPLTETNTKGVVTRTHPSTASSGKRWAEKRALSATEYFRAQQAQSDVNYVFTMRWDSVTRSIVPKDALLSGDTSGTHSWYDIQAVYDPDGRRKRIQILAKERDA